MLIIMGLHFKEDACDSDDDMLDDCQHESSFEEEPSEAAVNLNTNVSFNASLYSSSECAQAPLYPGSSVTLLQAGRSSFCGSPVILVLVKKAFPTSSLCRSISCQ